MERGLREFPRRIQGLSLYALAAMLCACGGGESDGGMADSSVQSDFRFVRPDGNSTAPPDPDAGVVEGDAAQSNDLGLPQEHDMMLRDVAHANDGQSPVDAGGPDMGPIDQDAGQQEPAPDPLSEIGSDTDEDGLDDAWERGAGNETLLDWQQADTDGDGVPDGLEDFDNDNLTNIEEQAAGRMATMTAGHRPHPFRADLLIELDAVTDRMVLPETLDIVVTAYSEAPFEGVSGHRGIGIHFYGDQFDLPATDFTADFAPRQRVLARNGPLFAEVPDAFPVHELVHVVIATRRTDRNSRGGEVITHADDISKTGVLVYADTIADVFPRCGLNDPPPIPFVTVDEALAGTLVHEIGHTLQLGHDTLAGGGVNAYNIMSVPTGCVDTRQRAHGEDNQDPSLGNSEDVAAPRFSQAATSLMDLTNKLSVDTSTLVDGDDGREM